MRPIFVRHRVNTIDELNAVDPRGGVEIDVRSDVARRGELHLSHDPWKKGVSLARWLGAFKRRRIRGPLILNTKEDGLEEKIFALLRAHGIRNFFFLDTAFPTLVKWTRRGQGKHFALRFSTFESRAGLAPFRGEVQWVWVDCFDGIPLEPKRLRGLRSFKICLVSPELQGKPVEWIARFSRLYPLADAVCTKRPEVWSALKKVSLR